MRGKRNKRTLSVLAASFALEISKLEAVFHPYWFEPDKTNKGP